MIVPQAELDAILDRKVRKRVLELPVRYGPKLGPDAKRARKKCPVRAGGVYHLYPPLPFERFLLRAEAIQPRKRSVVWLMGRVQRWDPKPVTITVRDVERSGKTWRVWFLLLRGDDAEDEAVEAAEALSDAPVYLAPDGGFTTVAARQAVPGDPEYLPPFAKDLARAREAARQKRQSPQRERVSMMQAQAGELQREMTDMKLRNRARRIAHDLAHLDLALRVLDSEASLARDEPDVDSDSPPSQGPSDVVSPAQLGE